jgi:hypothetical protein
VQQLSLAIGDDVLKALATRAGDEVVQGNLQEIPPAPQLYGIEVEEDVPAVESADRPQFAPEP